ncbi:hypothetical protein [Paenisporosarcina cavernae]|uniref:hypothetical protein n=1 Tax=Paenisporosarcina cavernae TaxID=2320858 RepID=UPI001EE53D62|nr:hypothetical protein [Paenisporosarcina cavernae]
MRKITSSDLLVYDVELSEFINRKMNVLKFQKEIEPLTIGEIEEISTTIKQANIEDISERELHNTAIQNRNIKREDMKFTCVICNKNVTQKVAAFCESNKKFQGKIYCFEHQKLLSK